MEILAEGCDTQACLARGGRRDGPCHTTSCRPDQIIHTPSIFPATEKMQPLLETSKVPSKLVYHWSWGKFSKLKVYSCMIFYAIISAMFVNVQVHNKFVHYPFYCRKHGVV